MKIGYFLSSEEWGPRGPRDPGSHGTGARASRVCGSPTTITLGTMSRATAHSCGRRSARSRLPHRGWASPPPSPVRRCGPIPRSSPRRPPPRPSCWTAASASGWAAARRSTSTSSATLARRRRAAGDARGGDRGDPHAVAGGRPGPPRTPLPRRARPHLRPPLAHARDRRLRVWREGGGAGRPGRRRLLHRRARRRLGASVPLQRRAGQARPGRPEGLLGEKTSARAGRHVHRLWPNEALPGELAQILPTPEHFEQAASWSPRRCWPRNVAAAPMSSVISTQSTPTRMPASTSYTSTRSVPTRSILRCLPRESAAAAALTHASGVIVVAAMQPAGWFSTV